MQNKIQDYLKLEQNQILGYGSFSQVYRVLNKQDKQVYAMKQIDLNKLSLKDQQKMHVEIDLHKHLDHPNIIKFYESFRQGHILFNVLEYASNGCLFYYINSKTGFNEELSLRFVYQVAQAVKYLHDRNIMHRDIKPENILLGPHFNVKLCDFGCASTIDDKKQRSTVCGTYCYMPPEIANEQVHSSSADIWSLGILLFELLHGKPPFEVYNFEEIKEQIKTDYIQIRVDLHPLIKDLMKNLLRKDANKRYNIDQLLAHPAMRLYDLDHQLSDQDIQHIIDVYMSKAHNSNMLPPDSIMDTMLEKNQPKLTKFFDDIYTSDVRKSINTLSQINGFFSATDDEKVSYKNTNINFFDVLEQKDNFGSYNNIQNDFAPYNNHSENKVIYQQDDFFDKTSNIYNSIQKPSTLNNNYNIQNGNYYTNNIQTSQNKQNYYNQQEQDSDEYEKLHDYQHREEPQNITKVVFANSSQIQYNDHQTQNFVQSPNSQKKYSVIIMNLRTI